MRGVIVLALLAGVALVAPRPASALPSTLIGHAASLDSINAVEHVARKPVYKQRKARRHAHRYDWTSRHDWTSRRYWRPYQYRYWKYYYPYGGPLF